MDCLKKLTWARAGCFALAVAVAGPAFSSSLQEQEGARELEGPRPSRRASSSECFLGAPLSTWARIFQDVSSSSSESSALLKVRVSLDHLYGLGLTEQ